MKRLGLFIILNLLVWSSLSYADSALAPIPRSRALVCIKSVTADEEPKPILLGRETREMGFADFMANDFYNGAVLRELFGPTRNDFKKYLEWLESDERTPQPLPDFGVFRGGRGYVLGKIQEFPIDAGAMQFGFHANERRLVDLMTFYAPPDSHFKGTSQKARVARANLLQALDTQVFGVYGALKNDSYHNLLVREIGSDGVLLASIYRRIPYRNGHSWDSFYPKHFRVPTNPRRDFKKIADVVDINNETVTVKIDLSRKPENRNQEVIQQMFFITHWQMVQKAYRESGLFPDTWDSTLYLLNDFIKTMESSNNNQQIYLMYERIAWESMLFRMNLAHQYVSIEMSGAGYQPYRYQTISDVFAPLYPIYGMAVERYPSGEVEFKRLFNNGNPDPLDVIHDPYEEGKGWNMQFFLHVAQQLEPNAKIVAISKTPIHTRYYKSLGFSLVDSTFNPAWNTNKDTLDATREGFIEKVSQKFRIQSGAGKN